MKRKRELDEDCAEFVVVAQNVESRANGAFVVDSGTGFVSEALPEFCGEKEIWVIFDVPKPLSAMIGIGRRVEGCVDLYRIEPLREKCCFVEAARFLLRIEDAGPVCVGPACGTDTYVSWRGSGGHLKDSLQTAVW